MSYSFNAEKVTAELIGWIKVYFEKNASPDTKAVLGISGGKDSSVAAAVCVQALGKDRVIGVMMPKGEQPDIDCSRLLVNTLGIQNYTVNIGSTVSAFTEELEKHIALTSQAVINTPARIRSLRWRTCREYV